MDKYTEVVNDEVFSKLSLQVAQFPKSLVHWEKLINYLITAATPINKNIDLQLYQLIKHTYTSFLAQFPFLENYHIDYALFEYKLGHIAKTHQVFQSALDLFHQRSLLIWMAYLGVCNEVVVNNRQLLRKYEEAESYIGLHFYSGEFWELYLEQVSKRCVSKKRYFIVLRKVLEIPLFSFSRFYALWFQSIDDVRDLSELSNFAPKEDLYQKLKIDITVTKRRGPYLQDAKKKLKKVTKELYMVTKYNVLEIHSLFESKLHIQYSPSLDTLIPSNQIDTWLNYIDYSINLRIDPLTHIIFQRALTVLSHYDLIWIKYAEWLIGWKDDLYSAKAILTQGLVMSLKKSVLIRLLLSTLAKLQEYGSLVELLGEVENSFQGNISSVEEYDIFWDYIQFKAFCSNAISQSRYSGAQPPAMLTEPLLGYIRERLSHCEKKEGQQALLSGIVQLQNKDTTELIERLIFEYIYENKWEYYTTSGFYWSFYCKLVALDPVKSYLQKRQHIVNDIWPKAFENKPVSQQIIDELKQFCLTYLPEDLESLDELVKIKE